mmetsp:Transcript_11316/g.38709  ORF Transcript_11316/g.38709 Transcript_11316/m.38709 type:complete len:93 (-) Transcript_11316:1209-1487(-)
MSRENRVKEHDAEREWRTASGSSSRSRPLLLATLPAGGVNARKRRRRHDLEQLLVRITRQSVCMHDLDLSRNVLTASITGSKREGRTSRPGG